MKKLALLLLLLAILVPLAGLAAPGWAEDCRPVKNYDELIKALSENVHVIVISADISVDETLNITHSVTIQAAEGVHPTLTYTGKDTNAVDRSVIKCDTNDVDLTLEGLTIKGGQGHQKKDENNTMNEYGGGLYVSGNVDVSVANCTFINNSADIGGGIYVYKGKDTTTVTNCTFTVNTADSGGGMRVDESAALSVNNCTFSQNTATTGGGLYVSGSTAVVANCTFTGNTAKHKDNGGGGGGGMNVEGSAATTVVNCTFAGNTADYGAEVRCDSTFNAINTIFWNSKDKYIYNNTSRTVKFYNCAYKNGAVYGKEVADIENFKNLSWSTRVSRDVEVEGVTHTVFPLTSEDTALIDKGRTSLSEVVEEAVAAIVDPALACDQLDKFGAFYWDWDTGSGTKIFVGTRDTSPDIGAIEYIEVSISPDILPDAAKSAKYMASLDVTPVSAGVSVTAAPWLTFTPADRTLTGTPTEVGKFSVAITAVYHANAVEKKLTLTVEETAEPQPEQDPEPEPEPEPEPDPESDPEPKPEPQPEPEPEPQPEPQPQPEPEPEPKPETKPEPETKPQTEPEPEPKSVPESEPKPDPTPEPQDLTIGDKTVPYLPLEEPDPGLSEKGNENLSELIEGLPEGTNILDNKNIHAPQTGNLNSFIESINEEEKKEGEAAATREITAVLTPVEVSEAGVYFMKVTASDDQKEALKGGHDLQYHVTPYSPNVEADAARLTGTEASDGSKGTLVDANGEKLDSSAYDGEKQLYVLAYFAQKDTPYAQYLTMEASGDITAPTSDKGSGGGCSAGLESLALLTLLFLIYRFCTPLC